LESRNATIQQEALDKNIMEYRYIGETGLRVSIVSFGNMVNHYGDKAQESND